MPVAQSILERTIGQSPDIIEGIATGKYRIEGGVIRVVAGQPGAGQIVAHLQFPSDPDMAKKAMEQLSSQISMANKGIESIQSSLGVLQSLQVANLALSGLNLVVSVAGFAIVCKKLNKISATLQEHSAKLDQLLNLTQGLHLRENLKDIAKFKATLDSVRQYSESGDNQQLRPLIFKIREQYEFAKLQLLGPMGKSASAVFRGNTDQVLLLQERFVHLGMALAFTQQKVGECKFALEALDDLHESWSQMNKLIVDQLETDQNWLENMTSEEYLGLKLFLAQRKKIIPAIEYQINLLKLFSEHPALAEAACNDSSEIILLVA